MEIHFEITNQCLLKCRHCSSLASKLGECMKYTENDMVNFLTNIKEKKEVFLTGGEPLLYPNLEKMLENLQTQVLDLELGMFTTGIIKDSVGVKSISKEYAKILAKSGLKVCYLSVYSYNEKEHDWMTKLDDSFKMLNISIKNLQDAGVEIRFNSVVTAKNIISYEKLIEFAERIGVTEVRMLKLINHGRASECWDELGITEEQYRMLVYDILKRKNQIRITASSIIDILPCRYLYDMDICPAGKKLLYVTNEGNIFPCASAKNNEQYKIGNICDPDINKKRDIFQINNNGKIFCK